jgi:hypothetical protein
VPQCCANQLYEREIHGSNRKNLGVTGGGGGFKNSQMMGTTFALFEKYLPATLQASATQFGRHLQLQTDHLLNSVVTVLCVFNGQGCAQRDLPHQAQIF